MRINSSSGSKWIQRNAEDMDLSERPRMAYFLEREGKAFIVTQEESGYGGEWVLREVRPLEAPDHERLKDLECFSLVFSHEGKGVLAQGMYRLEDGSGFRSELFAVPCSANEMAVTIN